MKAYCIFSEGTRSRKLRAVQPSVSRKACAAASPEGFHRRRLNGRCFMNKEDKQIALSKGVKEGHIIVLSLIAVPEGMHRLLREYPSVKLVTSEIDEGISKDFTVEPGIGNFGDRYFSE